MKGIIRVYYGETARNVHVRSNEHYCDLRNKRERSWMWKHIQNEHENENPEDIKFSWKISNKIRKPLERQLTESVNIARASPDENLNSKSEYNSHSIKRLSLPKENENFQCNACSAVFNKNVQLKEHFKINHNSCLLYTSPSPRDMRRSRMPSSA